MKFRALHVVLCSCLKLSWLCTRWGCILLNSDLRVLQCAYSWGRRSLWETRLPWKTGRLTRTVGCIFGSVAMVAMEWTYPFLWFCHKTWSPWWGGWCNQPNQGAHGSGKQEYKLQSVLGSRWTEAPNCDVSSAAPWERTATRLKPCGKYLREGEEHVYECACRWGLLACPWQGEESKLLRDRWMFSW